MQILTAYDSDGAHFICNMEGLVLELSDNKGVQANHLVLPLVPPMLNYHG